MPARTNYNAALRGRVRASVSGGIVVLLVSANSGYAALLRAWMCRARELGRELCDLMLFRQRPGSSQIRMRSEWVLNIIPMELQQNAMPMEFE